MSDTELPETCPDCGGNTKDYGATVVCRDCKASFERRPIEFEYVKTSGG